ncbi:MAG TPA: DnaJ domain-containing protein [Polyangiaceae bacterium]|nr:DnaJ domain-containing protein [Polyangiaceae bacterium]
MLSYVDGTSTEAEIAAAAGLELEQVVSMLSRLAELGVVRFEDPSERPRAPRSSLPAGRLTLRPVREARVDASVHPANALYDPKELDEPSDLDIERKRRILDVFYRLDSSTHYELLGLEPSADKRAIKSHYYEIVSVFHPDRYFGKNLGSFKPKLERIFRRVTEAHDVLTRPEARAEYDKYLQAQRRTTALDRTLNDEKARARELRAVEDGILAEARIGERRASMPPPMTPIPDRPAARSSSPAPGRPGSEPSRVASHESAELRRRALARKLGASLPPPGTRKSPAPTVHPSPPPTSPEAADRALLELKRRHEHRVLEARRDKAREYARRADDALAGRDLVEAVNALRIAAQLAPHDEALKQRLSEIETSAAAELAARYIEQARYEERENRHLDAVRSYSRALAGAPSPELHDRVAHCLIAAGAEPRRAVEHARLAVHGSPNTAAFRVTLARAYLLANLTESALGELERARALAPEDDTIRALIRRLQRGDT